MSRQAHKPLKEIRSTEKLQLVHSDVFGSMQTVLFGGNRYFVSFIDDYSRCVKVYFMQTKSEVLEKFKQFESMVTNGTGMRIKALRTDGGGEFISRTFEKFLEEKGIRHEKTVAHTPEQNNVAERMNRTLVESARTSLAHAKLSNGFWAEAINTAAHVRNRVATTAINPPTTPYERWFGKRPDVSHFRTFGCAAYAHVPNCKRKKLDKKAVKLRFVGYSESQKGYRLFDAISRKTVVVYDVIFNETDFFKEKSIECQKADSRKDEGEENAGLNAEHQRRHDEQVQDEGLGRAALLSWSQHCSRLRLEQFVLQPGAIHTKVAEALRNAGRKLRCHPNGCERQT
jgi:hypothetical protein